MSSISTRTVPCNTDDGTLATTLLSLDRQQVQLYLATIEPFTVSLLPRAVDDLVDALRTGDSIGIPCVHAEHGDQLIGVNPHLWWEHLGTGRVPMELYLLLPDDVQIEVVFGTEQVNQLISALRALSAALPSRPAARPARARHGGR
jgi:hypothetical protein